ncbi:hypothetical protein [Methanocella sp. MCL-LM]|uniref:hypothetical protein n=1 Tax=Methanocella sp. MCL-LM TaxID=3412035 RepID=UPI003C77387C
MSAEVSPTPRRISRREIREYLEAKGNLSVFEAAAALGVDPRVVVKHDLDALELQGIVDIVYTLDPAGKIDDTLTRIFYIGPGEPTDYRAAKKAKGRSC